MVRYPPAGRPARQWQTARTSDITHEAFDRTVAAQGCLDAALATVEDIRENDRYHGLRIRVPVRFGNANVTLQIDMGFGDAVCPRPRRL